MMLGVLVTVGGVSGLLFEAARIGEKNATQVACRARAVHLSLEPVSHQQRQVAGVIKMRVCQHHGVDAVDVDRQPRPIAQAQLLEALKEATIHKNSMLPSIQEILGSRDRAGRAQECDAHQWVTSRIPLASSRLTS